MSGSSVKEVVCRIAGASSGADEDPESSVLRRVVAAHLRARGKLGLRLHPGQMWSPRRADFRSQVSLDPARVSARLSDGRNPARVFIGRGSRYVARTAQPARGEPKSRSGRDAMTPRVESFACPRCAMLF